MDCGNYAEYFDKVKDSDTYVDVSYCGSHKQCKGTITNEASYKLLSKTDEQFQTKKTKVEILFAWSCSFI